jgi:hypothetical protein
MKPACPLALTTEQHTLIGETVEILGWTDHTMIETAERLDKQIADRMRRSTTVPHAVAHWAYAIKIAKISPLRSPGLSILRIMKGTK